MKKIYKVLLVFGLILLGINIFGLFRTMRNPAVYTEENTKRINDITIKYPEVKSELKKKNGESDKEFSIRINSVVSSGFVHYWKKEGITKYHLTVPVWENYLLYIASMIDPERYSRYEFSNYKKNLERGVGLCSTHSTIVKGVLNDYGIEANLLDIAGHVVVQAKVSENEWHILDPDYGIVVPHGIDVIEADPEIVRPYYKDMDALYKPDSEDPYTTDIVVELFAKEGNHFYTVDNWFEHFSYVAIWILPFLFMAPYIIEVNSKVKKRETKSAKA